MISTTPSLTYTGTSLLVRALAGEAITFTGFKIGNGDAPMDPGALEDLVNPLLSFGVSGIDRSQPGQVILRGTYDNSDVTSDFRVKEFGIFAQGETVEEFTSEGEATFTIAAKPRAVNSVTVDGEPATVSSYTPSTGALVLTEAPDSGADVSVRYPDGQDKLYAYTNDGDAAGMIRAYASDVVSEETVIVYLTIASSANVTAYLTPDAAYALKSDFDAHLAASNPHGTTKADVGLGNVENKSFNNGAPTWTMASTLQNLVSGETLSTAFGRLAKAVKSLIDHIANRSNPHQVTTTQIGAANREHTHSATDINSGVLPIARGGTGVSASSAQTLHQQMSGVHIGTYTGDGASSRDIDIGFTPRAVILYQADEGFYTYHKDVERHITHGGVATTFMNAMQVYSYTGGSRYTQAQVTTENDYTAIMIVQNGFRVYRRGYSSGGSPVYSNTNQNNAIYTYIAFE